jgi:hypothetical protein
MAVAASAIRVAPMVPAEPFRVWASALMASRSFAASAAASCAASVAWLSANRISMRTNFVASPRIAASPRSMSSPEIFVSRRSGSAGTAPAVVVPADPLSAGTHISPCGAGEVFGSHFSSVA